MKIVIAQVLLNNNIFKDLHVTQQGVSATGWHPAFGHALWHKTCSDVTGDGCLTHFYYAFIFKMGSSGLII